MTDERPSDGSLPLLMLRNPFTPPCGFDLTTTTVNSPKGLAAIDSWGYRLVVHPDGTCFLHETYYDQREGILGIARAVAHPCGDDAAAVREELALMSEGLAERALRYLDFVETPETSSGDGTSGVPPSL